MAPAPAPAEPTRAAGTDTPAAAVAEEDGGDEDTAMEEGEAQPAQLAMDEVQNPAA